MCKYDSVCERLYCMHKHGKQKKSVEIEFDQKDDENEIIEDSNFDK